MGNSGLVVTVLQSGWGRQVCSAPASPFSAGLLKVPAEAWRCRGSHRRLARWVRDRRVSGRAVLGGCGRGELVPLGSVVWTVCRQLVFTVTEGGGGDG